jgi:hypothetical protein
MPPALKATGQQGSWYADVKGLGRLPCIHRAWLSNGHYRERELAAYQQHARKKWLKWVDAIRAKNMVVLTDDEMVVGSNGPYFKRTGYRSAWNVTNLKVDTEKCLIELDLVQPCVAILR